MTNSNCEIRIQHIRFGQVLLKLFTFLINNADKEIYNIYQ